MFGFDRLDLTKITRQIALPSLSAEPTRSITLTVRHAGPGNRDHENALFRIVAGRPKDFAPPKPLSERPQPVDVDAALAEQQAFEARMHDETARVYAAAVIVDWANVFDGETPVPFSVDAAQRFVREMLQHAPDIWASQIRSFVTDRANFRDSPVADPAALGKK